VNLSGRNPTIVDTLAWIEHLRDNDATSKTLLTEAVRGAPTNPEIRLHAAIVSAATGDIPAAEAHLKEALRRNPALERDPSVQSLRERLNRGGANR
jgi:Flp pilus assembly protein TadD